MKVVDRVNRSLVNLTHICPVFGQHIYVTNVDQRALYTFSRAGIIESFGVINLLIEMGYLIETQSDQVYRITANGWNKVEHLEKDSSNSKSAFIAMSFSQDTSDNRDAFKQAITKCNYIPMTIDEKEHNNQIVPEIFYEISKSAFVIVDITYPNFGAYYEAGYAQGLGKQVIACCQKSVFDGEAGIQKPHFDISQKSLVIWKDKNDLVEKLCRRIEATIIR